MANRKYTSQARIEDYLKRDLSDHEVVGLPLLIEAATEWVNDYLDTNYTDSDDEVERFYDGEGYEEIDISPLKELTSVELIDSNGNVSHTYEETRYALEPANKNIKTSLRLKNGNWPKGIANIKVKGKYTSYDGQVPAAITLATTMLVGDYLNGTESIKRESIEGWSVEYDDMPDLTDRVTQVLAPYRRLLL